MKNSPYTIGIVTNIGRARERNEDAFAFAIRVRQFSRLQSDRGYIHRLSREQAALGSLFLVGDGVGGSEEGQTASTLATKSVLDTFYSLKRPARPDLRLEKAIAQANRAVHTFAKSVGKSASTTLVAFLCLDQYGYIANIGDSRAYRIHRGTITTLTQDHSQREEAVRSGDIPPEDGISIPDNRITRSVGREPDVSPDIFEVLVKSGDSIILCTDGLTRHVHDDEILTIVAQEREPQRAAQTLVDLANERGGKDNITVMIIRSGRVLSRDILYTVWRVLALLILLTGLAWAVWHSHRVWRGDVQPTLLLSTPASAVHAPTSTLQSLEGELLYE